jgi:GNAT superfamily N-acetyltransferase
MNPVRFEAYRPQWRAACLALFDANCPDYFTPGERADLERFLAEVGTGYVVCLDGDAVVGAYGLFGRTDSDRAALRWIMIAPAAQGAGLGRAIMAKVEQAARAAGATVVDIATSQKTAAFFDRIGAHALGEIADGWGPGLHRIDMEWSIGG